MTETDKVPDDILRLAEEAYQEAIYMTTSDEPQKMVQMVARAIMAERERSLFWCGVSTGCGVAADYIRKGAPRP